MIMPRAREKLRRTYYIYMCQEVDYFHAGMRLVDSEQIVNGSAYLTIKLKLSASLINCGERFGYILKNGITVEHLKTGYAISSVRLLLYLKMIIRQVSFTRQTPGGFAKGNPESPLEGVRLP
jgi:hypothetical protein